MEFSGAAQAACLPRVGRSPVLTHSKQIYVKRVAGKGRGVFAGGPITKGTVIEKVPLLLVPVQDVVGGLENPNLMMFFFQRNRKHLAVCLGYGTLYNHSYAPNARYDEGPGATMLFTAIRSIAPHEEICINYNGDPRDRTPMPFKVV
jgi:SET domain-containing protein